MNKSKKVKIRESREDRVFHLLNYIFMILCSICILVPFMKISGRAGKTVFSICSIIFS